MVSYTSLLVTLGLVARASAATEFSVTVYEGPKECEDADKVKVGDHVSMHYTGTIDESSATGEKGEKFDSSLDRDQTFDFKIGQGQVIPGWDEGLVGLCKGAKVCAFHTVE
jgi:FKBP-type peptidyl-prolyl cis-trans isomerase